MAKSVIGSFELLIYLTIDIVDDLCGGHLDEVIPRTTAFRADGGSDYSQLEVIEVRGETRRLLMSRGDWRK